MSFLTRISRISKTKCLNYGLSQILLESKGIFWPAKKPPVQSDLSLPEKVVTVLPNECPKDETQREVD